MPVWRANLLLQFNGQPTCGFSESWTWNDTPTLGLAQDKARNIASARRGPLAKQWFVAGVRLAKLTVATSTHPTSHTYLKSTYQPMPCGIFGPDKSAGQAGDADTPWTAVYVRIETNANDTPGFKGKSRFEQVRGVPDNLWDKGSWSKSRSGGLLDPFLNQVINGTGGGLACGRAYWPTNPVPPDGTAASFTGYQGYCIERASERRIGRPFSLLRGRQSRKPAP